MYCEYKNHLKKLVSDLSELIIEIIDDIPDNDYLLKTSENESETRSVNYMESKTEQKPLKLD